MGRALDDKGCGEDYRVLLFLAGHLFLVGFAGLWVGLESVFVDLHVFLKRL